MKTFSLQTKLYIYATWLAGLLTLAWQIHQMDTRQPWLLVLLCVLASLTLILKVEGSTNRSHYSFNFLVYGFAFALLGTPEAILVILVSNIVEWIWNKPPWFIQLFNTACYVVVMQAAGLLAEIVSPGLAANTWQSALGLLLAMTTFNLLNHLLVGIVVWLARGENFKQSGIFEFFPLALDLALLTFGASLSYVWQFNPFALGLFIVPIYLIYSTLRVPALERKTEVDGKTGLFNHEYFKKQLTNELARANRFDRPLSIIMADLDLLRNINNTYGHLAGDEVLIGIAQAMKKVVREYDVVCRFGGEEFAVLLPETSLAQAFERAETIRKTVEAMEFTIATSVTPIRATLSLGIAQRENFSQTQAEITHNADLALYQSKLSGRNRCYALSNETFVEFSQGSATLVPPAAPIPPAASPVAPPTVARLARAAESQPQNLTPAAAAPEPEPQPAASSVATSSSSRAATYFIAGLALAAVLAIVGLWNWMPLRVVPAGLDWLALAVIALMIALAEGFSIDLYMKQSAVSTSAIPILVAYLLFGAAGVLVASLVLAMALLLKYRSPASRFVFNLSNHILAGILMVGLLQLTGRHFLELPVPYQLVVCLLSALILYLFTTWMVAIGMGFSLHQPARLIWNEQFSWLGPYYLGIGLITYSLIFGYGHDHIMGLILMVIPMALLRVSQMQYINRTRAVVAELREKNQVLKQHAEEITELNEGLLGTLSEIIDLRDPYVLGHSKQVSQYATDIARRLGLNDRQVETIRKAGLLHDIGKLGIPMEILTKPSKLTAEEYETIKQHAALGGDLVQNSPSLRPLAGIIRHHHEFFDGRGYPDRLAGHDIAIEARIISVADAVEAMISDRHYRRAIHVDKIMEELKRCAGAQFDPLVVEAALTMLETQKETTELEITAQPIPAMLEFGRKVQVAQLSR